MNGSYFVATEEELERLSSFKTNDEAFNLAEDNAKMNPGETYYVLYPWSQHRHKHKTCPKCNKEFSAHELNFCGTCGTER